MTEEKIFAIDLLKALDVGTNNQILSEEEYKNSLVYDVKKEVLKTVKYLISIGYKKEN